MINEVEVLSLGKRAAAINCFEWRPGMLILKEKSGSTYRFVDFASSSVVELGQLTSVFTNRTSSMDYCNSIDFYSDAIPDCSDPATIGCLLYLVRDIYKIPTIWTVERQGIWYCCWSGATHGGDFGSGSSEIEALIAALENFDTMEK